jgi:transposase
MGHAKPLKSGREFAAWPGLVLGQTSSGGKLIIHVKESDAWIEQMKKRRPLNVGVVALANKMARTFCANWRIKDRPRKATRA